jgi:alkylhydroperoxidase family enzyme
MTERPVFAPMPDEEVRDECDLVRSVVDRGDGRARIVMDDVAAVGDAAARTWRHQALFTTNDYDQAALRELALTDEQLRDIGFTVVARLLALSRRA